MVAEEGRGPMSRKRMVRSRGWAAKMLVGTIREAYLVWRLLTDGRVPLWLKLMPIGGLLYLLFPIDVAPDLLLGLGQLDDLALLLLAFKLFTHLVPPDIVKEHRREINSIPGSYRVVKEEKANALEVPYRVIDDEK